MVITKCFQKLWPFPSSASSALANVDLALEQGVAPALFKALQAPALGLQGLQQQNGDWYLKQLLSDRQQKRQVNVRGTNTRAFTYVHLNLVLSFKDFYGAFFPCS